jgi:asparagine synthase (glutamine-hydrolysing)
MLSGGIDSSLVVALMQKNHPRPVRTFTIGFREKQFDESAQAEAVAKHLGTEHTTLFVHASEARDLVPQLPVIYDEPFADSSQLPTFLVSRLARAHVTVALTGDGGDELFAGYNRYLLGERLMRFTRAMPGPARRAGTSAMLAIAPEWWDRGLGLARRVRRGALAAVSGDRIHKLASVLKVRSEEVYRFLISAFESPGEVLLGGKEMPLPAPEGLEGIERMMYLDLVTYLVDDILVKVDRASMAASLEVRSPYLDHRVVELAWRFPLEEKLRAGRGKLPLRRLLERHVPRELFERPKMGFALPISDWLRSDLREWAESLLSAQALQDSAAWRPEVVRRLWVEHLSGRRNWQAQLWTVLMYQAWWRRSPVAVA